MSCRDVWCLLPLHVGWVLAWDVVLVAEAFLGSVPAFVGGCWYGGVGSVEGEGLVMWGIRLFECYMSWVAFGIRCLVWVEFACLCCSSVGRLGRWEVERCGAWRAESECGRGEPRGTGEMM